MATFPPNLEDDLAILPVHVDKSTTITGFYARLVRRDPQGPNDWIGTNDYGGAGESGYPAQLRCDI